MTQGIQTAPLAPTTTESRAEALRRRLRSRGGTVKRTAFGQVNWRGAGYGERILHYGIEAGWLVEDSRRRHRLMKIRAVFIFSYRKTPGEFPISRQDNDR